MIVKAIVPIVVSVNSYEIVSEVWLNVTIGHPPPPVLGPKHYVDVIQLKVNGTILDLSKTTYTAATFTIQDNLGQSSNSYMVQARASCNLHGYSEWSDSKTVPEYSLAAWHYS